MSKFINLVALAGNGFVAAKNKDPFYEGQLLADYLRSNKPIGKDERELLAQLVQGDWGRKPGRRVVTPSTPIVKAVVERLRELIGEGWKKESAKAKVVEEFDVKRTTVDNYEKMVVEREKAIERGMEQAKRYRQTPK